MVGGWLAPILNLLGMGGGGTVATPQIALHVGASHFDADGTYTITPQVGLATSTLTMRLHNHGDALLIVTGAFANVSNVTIEGTAPDTVLQPDATLLAAYMLTPSGYGAFSFDLVLSSNDPVTPTLTVTFEGRATIPVEHPNRRRVQPQEPLRARGAVITDWRRRG